MADIGDEKKAASELNGKGKMSFIWDYGRWGGLYPQDDKQFDVPLFFIIMYLCLMLNFCLFLKF